jgi:hypothetical protein
MTLVFGLLLLAVAWQLKISWLRPQLKLQKQQTALNFNNDFLQIFSMGQKRLISSTLWISTLLESDLKHVENDIDDSWMYLRFNSISNLDPMFLKNYQFGGQYLSIIKDDLKGAGLLMEKGIIHYPKDYILNFNLGFLYAIELEKYEEATEFLEMASKSPLAPKNIQTLIAKVKFMSTGDPVQTYEFLKTILETSKDKIVTDKLKSDLYSLKAEIDLKCLNFSNGSCATLDFDGNPYLLKNGKFISTKKFKSYQLHKRKKGASKEGSR